MKARPVAKLTDLSKQLDGPGYVAMCAHLCAGAIWLACSYKPPVPAPKPSLISTSLPPASNIIAREPARERPERRSA